MPFLKVKRFTQDPCYCSVAAIACISNYHNKKIDYDYAKKIADKNFKTVADEGMDSAESGILLTKLGFQSVKVVTTDLSIFDYSCCGYKKQGLINFLKKESRFKPEYRELIKNYIRFLKIQKNNEIIIDYDFSKYIKDSIDRGIPVWFSFNWTMFFRFSKAKDGKALDSIKGDEEIHASVIRGYNEKRVFITDSHTEYYKGKRKKFWGGKYFMNWEQLMTVMGTGDLIIAKDYHVV